MAIVVKKFGGTSVGSLERIRNVAILVKDYLKKNPKDSVAIVVSAMAGETNRLIQLAKDCVPNPDQRELDVLLATGEQVSIALLAMALKDIGLPARSFTSFQARIRTDDKFNNAQIEEIESERMRECLDEGVIPVIAGFQGIDDEDNITTLGRGGSDITAVAVAVAVKAKACYIYTDVEGVFSTDPRICSKTRQISKVCHEEMLEMASLGAKVLHPRSVYFAMRYRMPLVVLSTFNPVRETWIVKEEELMEKPLVTGITYRSDEAKITINDMAASIQNVNEVFQLLSANEVFVDMISQSGTSKGKTSISFTVPTDSGKKAMSLIEGIKTKLQFASVEIDQDIAKVSIVGIGMRYHTGVAAKLFETLAEENIDISMIGTSEIKMSVIISKNNWENAVQILHKAFIEDQPEVSQEAA